MGSFLLQKNALKTTARAWVIGCGADACYICKVVESWVEDPDQIDIKLDPYSTPPPKITILTARKPLYKYGSYLKIWWSNSLKRIKIFGLLSQTFYNLKIINFKAIMDLILDPDPTKAHKRDCSTIIYVGGGGTDSNSGKWLPSAVFFPIPVAASVDFMA